MSDVIYAKTEIYNLNQTSDRFIIELNKNFNEKYALYCIYYF